MVAPFSQKSSILNLYPNLPNGLNLPQIYVSNGIHIGNITDSHIKNKGICYKRSIDLGKSNGIVQNFTLHILLYADAEKVKMY